MDTRLYAEDEIKIFILYLMYHIGRPLEYEDINDIVMQDGFVGGIDFADCFADFIAVSTAYIAGKAGVYRQLRQAAAFCLIADSQ